MIDITEVINIVSKALDVNPDLVNENTEMNDLLQWDSLGHLTILAELHEHFGDRYNESEALSVASSVKEIHKALNS